MDTMSSSRSRVACISLAGFVFITGVGGIAGAAADEREDSGKHMFICAGDQARKAPDFLAVVDFDDDSPTYGHVIARANVDGPSAVGNEFHHIGLSADGKMVACGGLLSVLKGQDEVFFFDVSNPHAPKFHSSANPPLSAITDEFHALLTKSAHRGRVHARLDVDMPVAVTA